MKRFGITWIVVAAILVQGCATLTKGTSQDLSVNTDPPGAEVMVGTKQAQTPCNMVVKRSAESITVTKDGYKPVTLSLDKRFNAFPTIVGNILWLLPGLAIDFVSGAAYEIEPVNITMTPLKPADQNVHQTY